MPGGPLPRRVPNGACPPRPRVGTRRAGRNRETFEGRSGRLGRHRVLRPGGRQLLAPLAALLQVVAQDAEAQDQGLGGVEDRHRLLEAGR